MSLVQQLHSVLLIFLDKVEHAENIEVLVGLAMIVIILSVVLWGLNLIKSLLGASVSVLEHTVNMLKRIAKFSGYALILILLMYYIFAMKRQCFGVLDEDLTSCLNEQEWQAKQLENQEKTQPNTTQQGH